MDELARILDQIANTSSRNRKVSLLATWLRAQADTDLMRAVRFMSGQPVSGVTERKLSIGRAIFQEAALLATGIDAELFRFCRGEVGDSSETISLLLQGKTADLPVSLEAAEAHYMRLFAARKAADKTSLLAELLTRQSALTTKFFLKVITGSFRIGLQQKLVEEAIAEATGASLADVRAAANRTGDLAAVAVCARRKQLHTLEARLFHPLEFMLARPLDEAAELPASTEWLVEDKFDGIRSQVHFDSGKVRIFTRGLEDTTNAFPELVSAFSKLNGSGVVDGEVLAWQNDRALNFTVLQKRLARKKVSERLIEELPVAFIGYDILYRNKQLLLDLPIEERRQQLESLLEGHPLPLLISAQRLVEANEDIEATFAAARARGNEGLLLKRKASLYESGRRSANWLKVKRAYASLDVVVTAAEQGSGRRATMLSDYTFAVRDGERFLNVGKAYSGLTDDEIRDLTRIFRSIAKERFGKVTLVEPQVVLEVAFDGLQKSPRHKSGFALRFPRIIRWRKDKKSEDADTLDHVKELYERSLAQ
ncbi:MAG: cisplatin damage response ATP-dependent DNA ligase [Acidobacteria bacterium]|nr:cisplatin damage response ATP-dependent DNA ligase [Acidobacteriota bacterium]